MYRLSKRAAAPVIAFLVAIILLSSMSASIMLVSEESRRSTTGEVEQVEEVSEALRENVKVTLLSISGNGEVTLQIDNTGDVPVRLTKVLLKDDDGSLITASLPEPVEIPAGGSKTVTATISGDYSNVGVMSERGSIFSSRSNVIFMQTGLPSGTEWSATLNGETKSSTGESIIFEDVKPGTYSWSVSSPPSPDGARYVISPGSSGTIKVPDQTTVQVTYATQYYLSIKASPSEGGSVSPGSGWYDEGETITISATPNPRYRFGGWQGSYSGSENPKTIKISGPITETAIFVEQGKVTFTASGLSSDASGTVLVVDGVGYKYSDLPVSFTWDVGSKHTFEWKSPIGAGSGKRYIWTSTSGLSSARSGTITVPSGGGTVSASYKKQYYLTMRTSPSGGVSVSPSSGWHDAGSKVTISVSPSSGYRFDRWVGSGSGSYTGASSSARITMNAPITETAYFVKTGTVTFSASGLSSDASGTVLVVDGTSYAYSDLPVSFTWDAGTKHTFEWKSPVSAGTSKRYVWTSTSGLSTRRSGTITVPNNGGTVSASYKTQYKLTVQSGSGGTISPSPGSYWYDSGSKVSVTAKPNAGYSLDYWRLDGKNVGSKNPYTITMTSAHTIKAYFTKSAYKVTFTAEGVGSDALGTVLVVDGVSYSIGSLPKTFSWTLGSSHSFEWESPVSAGSDKRYVWTSTSGLSTSRKGTITVPIGGGEVKASYKTQYKLKIDVPDVKDYGVSTDPAPGSYWHDAGSRVKVTAVNNAPFEVTLQADTVTSGITRSLSKTKGTPKFTSILTVKVGSGVSSGTHRIHVIGSEYGWEFREWILDGKSSGTGSSITVTMNAPHTLEADFYMPHVKVTLSQSSITISRGGSAQITVTVEEVSSSGQNIKTLTVTVPPTVTVTVQDYKGKPLSGVTVTVGGESKRTDGSGRAVFTVNPGKYKIAVPAEIGFGVYHRDFYKWSDGEKSNSRTETISGDASFTAIYEALAFFGEFSASEIPPVVLVPPPSPGFTAKGTVYYGDPQPLGGVEVKVVFHLVSWGNLIGRKTVSVTATTDSNGKFHAKYNSLADALAYDLEYAEAYVVSSGYQSETVTYGTKKTFYTVTFTQSGLPAGTKWKVTLDGHEKSSTSNYIKFYMPNGAYSYTVESPIYEGSSTRYIADPSYGTVRVNGLAEDVSIKFSKEYKLTMKVSGLGSTDPAEGSHWIKAGSTVTIKAYPAGDHRFSRWDGSGKGSYSGTKNPATITMKEPITETAFFTKQALVLFDSTIGPDASGTVLVVDGRSYSASSLPKTFRWDVGSKHTFEWKSIVSAGSGKRYVWASASGLSTRRSGTITVPSNGGSITAYYKTQYALTVTVSPSGAGTTSLSGTKWCDAGSRITVSASPSSSFKVSLSASGLPRGVSVSFNPSSGTPSFKSALKITASSSAPSGSYTVTVRGLKSGYRFDCWKLDGKWVGSSSSYTVYVNAPHSLTAVFTQPKVRVDAEASPVNVKPGGSVSIPVKVSTGLSEDASDTFTLRIQKYCTVTVMLNDFHRGKPISGVTVTLDGESKRTDSSGKASFTVLEGKHTLTVPGSASAGSRGTLPFWKWSDGSTSRSRTVTVSSSQTYRALYKNILYFSSVNAWRSGSTYYAEANVRVKGYDGSSSYASYVAVKAAWKVWYWYRWWPDVIVKTGTANWKGYRKLSATISGWGITGIECAVETVTSGYVPARSWRKTVYSSSWAEVTFSASGLSGVSGTVLVVDGKSYRLSDLPKTFTWEAGSKHSFSWTSTFPINSNTRYAWKSTSGISSSRSGTITVPNGGGSVKATYGKEYRLYISRNIAGGYTVPSLGEHWYSPGSKVTIKAYPYDGYLFEKWVGSGRGSYTGTSRSATITVNEPITETVLFKEKPKVFTVTFYRSRYIGGKSWTVKFNGQKKSTTGPYITFCNVKPGWYSWYAYTVSGGTGIRYRPSPSSGAINVQDNIRKTIYFIEEHRLLMERSSGGYTSPGAGEHWYAPGTIVWISATPKSSSNPSQYYYTFHKWQGSGRGSYSGYSSSARIRVDDPVTEKPVFAYHYKVAVWHEGYYTYEQVWVPGHYEKKWVPGHYETRTRTETYWVKVPHTRWVRKPVYGYRKEPVYGYRWVRKRVCGWEWVRHTGWWGIPYYTLEYRCHYRWVRERYVRYYRYEKYVKYYRWVPETYYTWETRTRLVTYKVWVPGHYENKWIPGHYETKKVWHPGYYTYEWRVKYV